MILQHRGLNDHKPQEMQLTSTFCISNLHVILGIDSNGTINYHWKISNSIMNEFIVDIVTHHAIIIKIKNWTSLAKHVNCY